MGSSEIPSWELERTISRHGHEQSGSDAGRRTVMQQRGSKPYARNASPCPAGQEASQNRAWSCVRTAELPATFPRFHAESCCIHCHNKSSVTESHPRHTIKIVSTHPVPFGP